MINIPILRSRKSFDNPENTLRIDFDGTIVKQHDDHTRPHEFELRDGAKEGIEKIHEQGRKIIIWTSHPNHDEIIRFLNKNHVPFDGIEAKPEFLVHIDDKVIEANQSWENIMKEVPDPPRQPTEHSYSYHTLKFKANEAVREFLSFLKHIKCPIVGLDNYEAMAHAVEEPEHIVVFGGLKSEAKAHEKVNRDYDGDWSRLLDILRATVVMDTPECLYEALDEAKEKGELVRTQDKTRDPIAEPHILTNWKMPCGIIAEVQWFLKGDFLRWRQLVGEVPQEHLAEIQDILATKQLDMDEDRGPEDLMDKTNEGLDEKSLADGEKRSDTPLEEFRENQLRKNDLKRAAYESQSIYSDPKTGAWRHGPPPRGNKDTHKGRYAGDEDPWGHEVKGVELPSDGEKRVRRTYGSTRSAYASMFAGRRQQDLQQRPGKLNIFGTKRRLAGKMAVRGPTVPKEMFPKKAKDERYKRKSMEVDEQANERARNVDLIELPEDVVGAKCGNCVFFQEGYCNNVAVQQEVKEHYCCSLWEHPGMKREYESEGGEKAYKHPNPHQKLERNASIDRENRQYRKHDTIMARKTGRTVRSQAIQSNIPSTRQLLRDPETSGAVQRLHTEGRPGESRRAARMRRDEEYKSYKSPHPLPKLERNFVRDKYHRNARALATIVHKQTGRPIEETTRKEAPGMRTFRRQIGYEASERPGESHRAAKMRREYGGKALSAYNLNTGGALVQTSLGPKIPRREHVIQPLPEKRKMRHNTDRMEQIIHENEGGYGPSVRPVDLRESLLVRKKAYKHSNIYLPKLRRNILKRDANRSTQGLKIQTARHEGKPIRDIASRADKESFAPNRQTIRRGGADEEFYGGGTERAHKMRRSHGYAQNRDAWANVGVKEGEHYQRMSHNPRGQRRHDFRYRQSDKSLIQIPLFGSKSSHTAAVELGHYGGKVGGPARARKLSAARRREIAKMGGKARQRMKGK